MPSHLAARFSANATRDAAEEGGATGLRDAFNSPSRPFVLASTSVGQEGLDFHPYCHRLWHWNLPGNRVDMEQREGRVQRYMNHAVRLNIAANHSAAAQTSDGAAWLAMLAAAEAEVTRCGTSRQGLRPHWLYSGDALQAALTELQHLMGQPEEGPRKIFGGLHDLLASDPCPEELLPFRDILQRHILKTWPLAPGDDALGETVALGEPVLRSDRMSLRAVALLMQTPEPDVLAATGTNGRYAPEWTLIDSAEARAGFPQGLTESEFLKAVSLTPQQFAQARDAGLLMRNTGERWDAWAAQDLIDASLLGAEPLYVAMQGWCSLAQAAVRLQMNFPDIIEHIRSGRLARVGKYQQRSGFA